jgi:hypothetical protein
MIKPQKWIAQNRVHSETHFGCSRKKGAAKLESSSLQPGFEEEENFHLTTYAAEHNTHP